MQFNNIKHQFLATLAILHVIWFVQPISSRGDDSVWQVGAASVAITPHEPIWMGGYASRTKPSAGKVHELYAKALVLQDAHQNRFVFVTTDLLGITPELRGYVEDQVESQYELPAAALLMNASHTHCGPEIRESMVVQRGGGAEFAAKARQYTRDLADKIVRMIGQAMEKMQTATLTYSYARAGFAMNRRLPTPDGVKNSPYPDGPVDHQVPVLRAESTDGRLLAVLFGYACHNTTLSFQLLCGDYAGFAQGYIEEAHPGTVALFMMGCGADQNPYPRRTLELAKQHGRSLANAVAAALQTTSTRSVRGPVRSELDYVMLEFSKPPSREELNRRIEENRGRTAQHARRLLQQLDQNGTLRTAYPFPVQAVQFGPDLTLVALCGESVVDYSLRLKNELRESADDRIDEPGSVVWVAGYSNHVFGYLPSRRVVEEGGYEGARAMESTNYPGPFALSVEERIVGKAHELVSRARNAPSRGLP